MPAAPYCRVQQEPIALFVAAASPSSHCSAKGRFNRMIAGPLPFLLASVAVATGAASGVSGMRLRGSLDRALAFATLVLAQIVATLLVAGAVFKRLEAGIVVPVAGGLALALVVLWSITGGRARWSATRRRRVGPMLFDGWHRARRHPWECAVGLLAAAAVAWRTLVAYVLPPYDYDGMWYHVTTVAGWLQAGDFTRNPLNLWSAVFPANGELTFAWPVVLTGNDTWINGVQVGFVVLGAASVAGLSRLVGATTPTAAAAGALFALTPVVLAQATTNYVDVAIASTFLASLYFVVRFVRAEDGSASPPTTRPATILLLPAGLAGGFALGTKGAGIVYLGVLTGVLVAGLALRRVRRGVPWRDVIAALAAFAVPALAVGGFWYARNLVDYGNPLYPVKVELLGREVLPGKFTVRDVAKSLPPRDPGDRPELVRVVRSWAHDIAPWSHPGVEYYSEEQRDGGFGMQWAYLQLPALGLVSLDVVSRRGVRLGRLVGPFHGDRATLRLVVVAIGATWLLNPYKWWSRWTIVLAGAGAIALATLVQRLERPMVARVVKGATVVLVCGSLWYTTAAIRANYGRLVRPAEIVRLADAPGRHRTTGAVFLPDYRWVDGIEDDARIGVVLGTTRATGAFSYFFAPLFGPHLERRVVAVDAPRPEELAQRAEAAGVGYVFLRNDGQANAWARADRAHFRLLSDGRVFSAFEVREA